MSETVSVGVTVLDLRGQICPASLLLSLRRINGMANDLRSGAAILEILTDNRDSVGTISDAAGSMGFAVTALKEEAHYRLVVKQGE